MIRKRDGGFTLIEMLIVVAIVGLLAGTAVGQYRRAVQRSREALLRENLYIMRSQINSYVAANGEHPFDLQTLVLEGYLRDIPVDPITRSKDTWVTIQALPTDEDLSVEPGIEDVQSGADGYGMDGTAYADW
jgi:general secretion pathway protein G